VKVRVIRPEHLREVPLFPLPGTVLLPRTLISLHVFEPRYRTMTEDCIEGHRLMVVAMVDPTLPPDEHGRPAVHSVAGLGALRRAVKLPDGRFNLVIEGLARVDISDELPPDRVYRRSHARVIRDVVPDDESAVSASMASVRALCSRAIVDMNESEATGIDNISQVDDPGQLADMVAAATMNESLDRQQVLAEPDVDKRLQIVAGTLGAYLLTQSPTQSEGGFGWGIRTGEA